jgi:ferredoxin-nitrite reductase
LRGLRANIGGEIVDAVAIYTGGKTGPDAVAGKEVMELVPCDDRLPEVVAGIIRERERMQAALDSKPDLVEEMPNGLRQSA